MCHQKCLERLRMNQRMTQRRSNFVRRMALCRGCDGGSFFALMRSWPLRPVWFRPLPYASRDRLLAAHARNMRQVHCLNRADKCGVAPPLMLSLPLLNVIVLGETLIPCPAATNSSSPSQSLEWLPHFRETLCFQRSGCPQIIGQTWADHVWTEPKCNLG